MAQSRINKEIASICNSKLFRGHYDEERKLCYLGFKGAGVYEGQFHVISIDFYNNEGYDDYRYPLHPPTVRFVTPIYHANVSSSGSICLDVISSKWNAAYNAEAIFNSIIALLASPNTGSALNHEAAREKNSTFAEAAAHYYRARLSHDTPVDEEETRSEAELMIALLASKDDS